MPGTVLLQVDGNVAHVVLSNPGRRNAVSWPMLTALDAVVTGLADRTDIAAVVLVGEGTDFCVGADLAAAPEQRTLRRDSVAADTERLTAVTATATAFYRLPQVTIAALDGGCAGAGLSLALAADLRVAADRAVLNTAFVGAGLSGDLGSAWHLVRAVGPARARELLLDPGKVTAGRALDLGLVARVVPADELADDAVRWARRIAAHAPLALRGAKQNLLAATDHDLDTYVPGEVDRMVATFHTQDAQEAAAAFLARRAPVFTGR
ncbi:enoyl-CoA hydratase/isomerase family protein [Pimelobacter simplex]|uniref:enoyl-CoA hydratase/isomerase family protein n=1 Tax=Nocardioides simplex TaxID=2045 RepID=UPI003AAB6C51